jgi:hypothetical protein
VLTESDLGILGRRWNLDTPGFRYAFHFCTVERSERAFRKSQFLVEHAYQDATSIGTRLDERLDSVFHANIDGGRVYFVDDFGVCEGVVL